MKNKKEVTPKKYPLTPTQTARAQRTRPEQNITSVAAAAAKVAAATQALNTAVANLNSAVAANTNQQQPSKSPIKKLSKL